MNDLLHRSLLIFCGFLLLLTAPGQRHANAYLLPTEDNFISLAHQSAPTNTTDTKTTFVVYDNLTQPGGHVSQPPVIVPGSEAFVPIDHIEVNILLHSIFRRPKSVDDELANLLYANLRFQQILLDYRKVRQQAQGVLVGFEKDQKKDSPRPLSRSPKPSTASIPTKKQTRPSLYAEWQELKKDYVQLKKLFANEIRANTGDEKQASSLFAPDAISPSSSSGAMTTGSSKRESITFYQPRSKDQKSIRQYYEQQAKQSKSKRRESELGAASIGDAQRGKGKGTAINTDWKRRDEGTDLVKVLQGIIGFILENRILVGILILIFLAVFLLTPR